MQDILVYTLIYLGVVLAIYQVYSIYSEQIFGDRECHDDAALRELAAEAGGTRPASAAFRQAVAERFGPELDPRLALAAVTGGRAAATAGPLRRRASRLRCGNGLRVRHPLGWQTRPPSRNPRGVLLAVIIVNCLAAIFLGGLSVYTLGYEVSAPSLAWMNREAVLMLLIYAIVLITQLVARLDGYLHDLYQIGRLAPHLPDAG